MPPSRVDADRLAMFVEGVDVNFERARNEAYEPGHAEAPFEERRLARSEHRELWIDDDMEGHRPSLEQCESLRLHVSLVLRSVLDDRKLQRLTDLRRGKPDTRRVAHRLAHAVDELLDELAANLVRAEEPRAVA